MTTRTHTPAPWKRGHAPTCGNGMDAKGYAICAGPHVVARVLGLGYPIGKGSHPESDANANLIVASPVLLRELQRIAAALDKLGFGDEHTQISGVDTVEALAELYPYIQTAIATATEGT